MPNATDPNETPDGHDDDLQPSDQPPTTVWDAIQHPKIARGVENLLSAATRAVDEYSKNQPEVLKAHVRLAAWSYVFGFSIFAGVGFLGWIGVLSHETTATILGALIGYWYGQREKQRR